MSDAEWERYYARKLIFEKQGDFSSLRELLDQRYGTTSPERHAQECAVLWREGRKNEALANALCRLRGSDYSVTHIILAASYTLALKDHIAAEYLKNEFLSQFEETGSIQFISYVYCKLNGLPITTELECTARMLNSA